MVKFVTKCLYCGYTEDGKFTRCCKCAETKYIKTKKIEIHKYYEDDKPEKDLSIDFDAMMEYYNTNED